jgi:hypothetical protein
LGKCETREVRSEWQTKHLLSLFTITYGIHNLSKMKRKKPKAKSKKKIIVALVILVLLVIAFYFLDKYVGNIFTIHN